MANRLLIVEDDSASRELLQLKLGTRYDIDMAPDMKTTVHLLTTRDHYDAVLLDIGLPDYPMSVDAPRPSAVEYVKQMAPLAAIVVLSGFFDADFINKTIRQSASSYLIKGYDDVNADALETSINAAITSHRVGRKIDDA